MNMPRLVFCDVAFQYSTVLKTRGTPIIDVLLRRATARDTTVYFNDFVNLFSQHSTVFNQEVKAHL